MDLPSRPRSKLLLAILVLPALVVLLALGTWQMQRLAWKQDLLAKIELQLSASPIAVGDLADKLKAGELAQSDLDYLPASAEGVFDHANERHFFATYKGISGYFIYTPLKLMPPQNSIVFINRGFVPFDQKEATTRPDTLITGIQKINGLARKRLDRKPSWIVPENDPAANIYYWKDLDQMRQGLAEDADTNLLPFFIDDGFPSSPGTLGQWPVNGVTLIDLPNNHLQYAFTWYGLALTLFIISIVLVRRRPRS